MTTKSNCIVNKEVFYPITTADFVIVGSKTLQEILDEGISKGYDYILPQVRVESELLVVNGDEIIGLTTDKNEVEADVAYISKDNQFFEKCTISYQGNSTLANPKKGFSINFTSKHRFNNWIATDGFHLKGYYNDWTHSRDLVNNELIEQIYRSRKVVRPYMKYNDFGDNGIKSLGANAYCHIFGFPVELYINGKYWGLYSLNLKKFNGNYHLLKNNANHIMFEPDNNATITSASWNWTNIEVRCPKSLITNKDGSKYDGDHPQEIADGDVKTSILSFISWLSSISTSMSEAQLEERLNTEEFIDWYLFNWFVDNNDIVGKNTLYTTWDSVHWSLLLYDLDNTYGMSTSWNTGGDAQASALRDTYGIKANSCGPWIAKIATILDSRIKARYAELRKEIFTSANIRMLFNDFTENVGIDAYERDVARWNYPSYGQSDQHFVFNVDKVVTWIDNRITFLDNKFGYTE